MTISRRQFLLGMGLGASMLLLPSLNRARATTGADSAPRLSMTISRGRRDLPQICLTYDDLWDEDIALEMAQAFADHDMRVTFFPAGSAITANIDRPKPGYADLYKQIYDMGHEFGCHLYTHTDITEADVHRLKWWEMEPWLDEMERALGFPYEPCCIRPPMGIVTQALHLIAQEYELPIVLWSADTRDSFCTVDYCDELLLGYFVNQLNNGEIFLQHTIPASAAIIDGQVEALAEAEMENVLLSDMLAALLDEDYDASRGDDEADDSANTDEEDADTEGTPEPRSFG